MKPSQLTLGVITFLLILTGARSSSAQAQQTDFSGTWTINKAKIQFGEAPEWIVAKGFNIQQGKDNINLERILIDDQNQEHPFQEELSFDGKPSSNLTYNKVKKTSTVAWINSGKSFVLSSTGVTEDGQPGSSSKEIWNLDDNGQTLIIDRSVQQADGFEYTIKTYYDKKK